jgi:hypothetical protein
MHASVGHEQRLVNPRITFVAGLEILAAIRRGAKACV